MAFALGSRRELSANAKIGFHLGETNVQVGNPDHFDQDGRLAAWIVWIGETGVADDGGSREHALKLALYLKLHQCGDTLAILVAERGIVARNVVEECEDGVKAGHAVKAKGAISVKKEDWAVLNVHDFGQGSTTGWSEADRTGKCRPFGFRYAAQSRGYLRPGRAPLPFHSAHDATQFVAIRCESSPVRFGESVPFGSERVASCGDIPEGIAHAVEILFHLLSQRADDLVRPTWPDAGLRRELGLQITHHPVYAANNLDGVGRTPHHARVDAQTHC